MRTGFPILCRGTWDPFKNKTELRSFDYFTPLFLSWYFFCEAKNTQKEISKIATWKWLPTNDLSSILFLIGSKVPPKKKGKSVGFIFMYEKKTDIIWIFPKNVFLEIWVIPLKLTETCTTNDPSSILFLIGSEVPPKKTGKPAGIIFMLAQQSVLCRIFEFQNSKFWMKITPCGFTCRYEPFFQQWNSFTFRLTCLFYTFLSLSECNHMFKSFFVATGKNMWAVVLFFKIQKFGWKSLLGPFEIQLLFGDHTVWHFFKSVRMHSSVQKLFWSNR